MPVPREQEMGGKGGGKKVRMLAYLYVKQVPVPAVKVIGHCEEGDTVLCKGRLSEIIEFAGARLVRGGRGCFEREAWGQNSRAEHMRQQQEFLLLQQQVLVQELRLLRNIAKMASAQDPF